MATVREVKYKCSKCDAEDKVKLFPEESVPQAINCYKCHAGFQKDLNEMLMTRNGMFPAGRAA